ncbi:hypothetical protein M9H77_17691 [Catharanthus roseus]|uniref:Uncharacterized protein n=1 Tax=Catharanthus roseus TaxID=4058 RepID=A0ACC0B5N5_CATRO|nr:hypothetical protein M9H77_17691 [Catharanthus roseus]
MRVKLYNIKLLLVEFISGCLAGTDYEMPELISDYLVMGSGFCPWSPTVTLHALLNSGVEAALMCLNSLRLPNCIRTPHVVDLGRTEGLGVSQVVSEHLSSILGIRCHTTFIDGYTRRAHSWAGPTRLHHHSRDRRRDVPKPKEVAPTDAESIIIFVVDGSPIAALPTPVLPAESVSSLPVLPLLLRGGVREHDICGYCLCREQRIEAAGQQIAELRDEVAWMDGLFYMARQACRQESAMTVDKARAELESQPGCSSSHSFRVMDTRSPGFRNMSSSQSPNHVDEPVSENSQKRQSEPIREATPVLTQEFFREVEQEIKSKLFLEQLNDIYDILKYKDALRVTFAVFRLRGMAKDWWLRASKARSLKDQLWTWNDF